MQKHLLKSFLFAVIFSSCVSTAHQNGSDRHQANSSHVTETAFEVADSTYIMPSDLPAGMSPVSLMELPRTEEGAFVLSAGLYEADFKSFCLQPGTPDPTSKDVYFLGHLEGSRKEIVQTILLNSRKQPQLDQKNVQLLLWSVVSHSDFQKLSFEVQYTARQLLTPKQVFELQGGVMGVVKTMAASMPSTGNHNELKNLFDLSVRSYEAYEKIAVIKTPSNIRRPEMTRDQWYKQKEGYYVRFLPDNYKETKIQVYVPENLIDSNVAETGNYIVFDPASRVIFPANSNAQRLGIGGPVVDIVKSVIRNIGSRKSLPQPKKPPVNKTPT